MEQRMKTPLVKLLIMLTCVTLVLGGCGPKPKPEATVLTFIEKMNAYDADGCIELLDSSLAKQTEASMGLGGMLASGLMGIEMDGSSLIALLPMLTGFLQLAGFGMDLPQWRFADYTTQENGNKATVSGSMYHKAAQSGDADAQFSYAGYFWAHTNNNEDYPSALRWYEKAAQQGHAASLNALGFFHQEGHGTPVDYARAVDFYQRAGEAGDRRAWYLLGLLYLEGKGVEKNRDKALELLRQSARLGHRPAEDKLAELTGGKLA